MDIVQMAVVLGFGLALVSKLDDLIDKRPDFKKQMVSTIMNFPNAKYSDIVKKSNKIFIQLFKIIYEYKASENYFLWMWVFSSFISTLLLGLFIQIYQITVPLEHLLIFNIILVSYIYLITYLLTNKLKTKKSIINSTMVFSLLLSGVIFTYLFNNLISVIYSDFEFPHKNIIFLIIMFGWIVGVTFVNYLYKLDKSPVRVIITSFLAIIFLTLLKKDILTSFISDYNEIGIIVLAYLLLNVFADSISLLETDIVLRLAAKGNIKRFAALGLFDILLSAVIFLAIPLSTGNLDVFLDAMLFKGEHPWLGVLFWSTFSTSIVFWLFLLSVFVLTILQKVLKYYVKLNVALPISEKPITCLYVTAVVVIIPFMLF